jgi:hypothetical protein
LSYYDGVDAVKELDDPPAVTEHLANGWILLAIKEKSETKIDTVTNLPVNETSIIYILGYKKTSELERFQPVTNFVVTSDHLGELPWRGYKRGSGEWVFYDANKYRSPPLTPTQLKVHALLVSKLSDGNPKIEIGDYVYQKSGDFISRKERNK